MKITINKLNGDNVFNQIQKALEVVSKIEIAFSNDESITIDLSEIRWSLPCFITLISEKIMEVNRKGAKIDYVLPKDVRVREWFSKMGFPFGNKSDGMSFISLRHFEKEPSSKNQINTEANSIIQEMSKKIPSNFGNIYRYLIGELSDNIDQHSCFSFASMMAQYYPNKNFLDIAVFDNGLTIPGNFEKNDIKFISDAEALEKAFLGEVTTKAEELMRAYGLKSCKNLSTLGAKGELYVVSRKGIVIIRGEEANFKELKENELNGTFLYFRIPCPGENFDYTKFV